MFYQLLLLAIFKYTFHHFGQCQWCLDSNLHA
jgi:hypothetical protein